LALTLICGTYKPIVSKLFTVNYFSFWRNFIRWAGHVARMGEERKVYKVLVRKPKGKRPLGLGGVDWIRLAQDRDRWRAVVSAVMNLRVLAPRS
jgi:hypothetical protein